MADGSGGEDETAKGEAKNGNGKWFRIYVPSKGMESVAHFGKPGPSYGYPGITFYTKSDLVAKVQHKIFLNSGLETIAVAGEQMTLVSNAAVNVIGEGAVNVGSPGAIVLSSIRSAPNMPYQTVESGGMEVPTDKGHLEYLKKRQIFYQSIKSLHNWAIAIDATVSVAKTALGYKVPPTFPLALASLGETLELVNAGFETVKNWSEALKPSPNADGTSEGYDSTGKPDLMLDPAKKASASPEGDEAFLNGDVGAAASATYKAAKDVKGGLDKINMFTPKGSALKTVGEKYKKIFGAVTALNKLSKNIFGKEIIATESKKTEDGGRVVVLAEKEMFTGVGGKQVTVAAGGVEFWVPSISNSFQVTAGGGIAMKSALKTEIFSVQAVSVEGMLGGTLVASGPTHVASRKKELSMIAPQIKLGSKKADLGKHASKINNILQSAWNPTVQNPTKEITVQTEPDGVIKIHIFDKDREVEMTKDHIKMHFKPSNATFIMDKDGFTMTTDKKIKMSAKEGIAMDTDDSIKGIAKKSALFRVSSSEVKVDGQSALLKQGSHETHLSGATNKHK